MQLPLIENDEEGWRDGDAGAPVLRTEEDEEGSRGEITWCLPARLDALIESIRRWDGWTGRQRRRRRRGGSVRTLKCQRCQ